MSTVARPREIFDRRAVAEVLSAAGPERGPVVTRLKQALKDAHEEIRRRFEAGATGTTAVREHRFLIDQLIRALHDFVYEKVYPLANPTSGELLSIVAVGGYGRGEL